MFPFSERHDDANNVDEEVDVKKNQINKLRKNNHQLRDSKHDVTNYANESEKKGFSNKSDHSPALLGLVPENKKICMNKTLRGQFFVTRFCCVLFPRNEKNGQNSAHEAYSNL